MEGLRLLERIALMEEDPEMRGLLDKDLVVSSIITNLSNILNTKLGSAQTVPDLGTPDFTMILGRSKEENFRFLKDVIVDVIEKYEPRLQNVTIEPEEDEDPFTLKFVIKGEIILERNAFFIHFLSTVRPDGKIEFNGK